MKKLLILLSLVLIISCDPDQEDKTTCYSYLNGTNRDVKLEFYDYNSGQFVTEIGIYDKNGIGLLTNFCKSSRRALGPVSVIRMDSIVVKFDNNKRLVYLKENDLGGPDLLYHTDDYQRDGNSLNFSYTFTEEDYNDAIPY